MQEVTKKINGFETTVLEGDDADERTPSEERVGSETTDVMGGLTDERSNLNRLKEKQAEPVATKARKSTSNKSADGQ
jgi:hypothetical protein